MTRALALFAGVFALAMPAIPVTAEDGTLSITGGCGGVSLTVDIPFDEAPAPRDDHGCCDRIACHAACERQKRQQRPR